MFSPKAKITLATGAGSGIGPARLAVADVAQESACRELIKRVLAEDSNHRDVLVNNADVGHFGTILTTDLADLDRLCRVDFPGAYHLSRAVLPAVIERKAGSIINLGSIASVIVIESRFADTVTVEIDKVGALTNPVVAEACG